MAIDTFCSYYTARVDKKRAWFLSGVLRNESNMVLERCLDKQAGLFEFFVPIAMEPHFLEVAGFLFKNGYLFELKKVKNRLSGGE